MLRVGMRFQQCPHHFDMAVLRRLDQRRAPIVGGGVVEVGMRFQQRPHHFDIAALRRLDQRRAPVVGGGVVGA